MPDLTNLLIDQIEALVSGGTLPANKAKPLISKTSSRPVRRITSGPSPGSSSHRNRYDR